MDLSRETNRPSIGKIDLLSLAFLSGLALLPPIVEWHKQATLLAIGVLQILESRLIFWIPRRGYAYSVLMKILLATLLIAHTSDVGINSSYYPVYYLPVVTAAIYFTPAVTMLWTALASLAYCSLLIPALEDYELTASGASVLAIRIFFFFFAAMLVNRFVMDNRRQMERYREVSETLSEANRQLRNVEAEKRRSERLAALGQLSAGLAHEIRNPLGVIKGSAEMLKQKVQDTQPLASELAGYISSEVDRVNSLVARFLDFARPSRLELHEERMPEIVDRALEAARAQFPNSPVKVERSYAEDLPRVPADAQLCEQVFVNLITNAYQAMNGAGGLLRVEISPNLASDERGLNVIVEDSGPGVPADLRGRIFDPFFTSKKAGVGLGLSIASKIVDDHRGWIRLENQPGKGARFTVFFPQDQET